MKLVLSVISMGFLLFMIALSLGILHVLYNILLHMSPSWFMNTTTPNTTINKTIKVVEHDSDIGKFDRKTIILIILLFVVNSLIVAIIKYAYSR